MHKNEKTQNSHSFLALAFFRGICLSRHQRIWNQHKILRVFDTHLDIFKEKKFLGHNSTFCNLKMQMRKKLYIFKHFAKSKKLFFCLYLSISVWFLLKFPKKYKIEAPYCTPLCAHPQDIATWGPWGKGASNRIVPYSICDTDSWIFFAKRIGQTKVRKSIDIFKSA